jgi:alpha-amylase/alpha-mannosidase (GH57 family)
MIGFAYASWHADDAVSNFIHHLENIAQACHDRPDSVVSIVLDGENAWEYYPENGYYFLRALYERLAAHPGIELTTFSDCLVDPEKMTALPHVVAGSWVYGTFSTWIGDPDKNRAWDMLGDAKRSYDRALDTGVLNAKQLVIAEHVPGPILVGVADPGGEGTVHPAASDYMWQHGHFLRRYQAIGEGRQFNIRVRA